jgi:hypothetical protein
VDFLLTSVYEKCNKIKRRKLWHKLQGLNSNSLPWLVGGDFNIVRSLDERFGGKPVHQVAFESYTPVDSLICVVGMGFYPKQAGRKRSI